MTAIMKICVLTVCAAAIASAASVSSTITFNGTAALNAAQTLVTATGTVSLTNIASGGQFAVSLPFDFTVATETGTVTLNFTGGTMTGTISAPLALLIAIEEGVVTSGTGSITITGGTGSYSGYTGSFPSVSGGGTGVAGSGAFTIAGLGTINTGGTITSPPPTPTITAVLDAGSYTPNIAEGSIFVVKGTNLSAAGFVEFGFPLPSACSAGLCSGAASGQIAFTPLAGGAAIQAYLVYLYNQSGVNQLAAILPSNVATGTYNVTVTNNNGTVSAPFPVTVVQRKAGLITQDRSGSGLAVIQNYISQSELDVDRFTTGAVSGTTISPARPGQTLIAWATGMGPVTSADNTASPGFNFAANGVNVQVIVGGVSVTPLYAGRAPGLAGADQINFVLPANIPTGCTVSFQVSVNGALSNPTFIAIAPDATSSACVLPGFTSAQLQNLDNGGTTTTGGFTVTQFSTTETIPGTGQVTAKVDAAGGAFTQYTGFEIAGYQNFAAPSGACQVLTASGSTPSLVGGGGKNLDAGAISLTGPSGSGIANLPLTETSNSYSVSIATELAGIVNLPAQQNNGTVIAGTYTLKGAGGKDVGAFNASMMLGSPLTITGGLPASVTRNAGLTLNWTGGNATDVVVIAGSSGTSGNSTEFICTTTAGKGGFTVPASILQQLPASTASGSFLAVESATNPAAGSGLFNAPLTGGGSITNATFLGLVGIGATPIYQ